jgi:hypothetical protein
MIKNFEKSLQDFTEKELLENVDKWDPKFGTLAYYELLRRLSVEDSLSSKRYAKWSLVISVTAILLSLLTSTVQIYLA